MVEFLEGDPDQLRHFKGRGCPNIVRKFSKPPNLIKEEDAERAWILHLCQRAKTLRKLIPKLQQWIARLQVVIVPTCIFFRAIELVRRSTEGALILAKHLNLSFEGDALVHCVLYLPQVPRPELGVARALKY